MTEGSVERWGTFDTLQNQRRESIELVAFVSHRIFRFGLA